jgi:hypothetical protein
MEEFRLDRTAFFAGTHQEVERNNRKHWQSLTYKERLKESEYLSSIAFRYDSGSLPVFDKTAFSTRKLGG